LFRKFWREPGVRLFKEERTMMKKRMLLLVLLFLAAPLLMWSGGQTDVGGVKKVEITFAHFWGGGKHYTNSLNEAIDRFKAENPNILMKVDSYPTDDPYKPKLAADCAAGTVPDIFFSWPGPRAKVYVESGYLLDITKYLNEDPAWRDDFVAGTLQQCTYKGMQASVPIENFVVPMYYNKEIFAKYNLSPPDTYDDLMRIVKVLRNNNVTPLTGCIDNGWTLGLYWHSMSNRILGTPAVLKAYDVGDFTAPGYLDAAKRLLDFRENQAFPDDFISLHNDEATNLFIAEEAAMYFHGTWFIGNFVAEGVPKDFIDKVGFFNFPSIPGGKGSNRDWLSGVIVSIAMAKKLEETPEKLDAAFKFVKYFTSPEIAKFMAEDGKLNMPVRKDLDPAKYGRLNTEIVNAVSGANNSYNLHTLLPPPKFRRLLEDELSAIWLGQKTPEEAAAKVRDGTAEAYQ
jgi:raffinose/stachyose/melibiose transport system substrate-binding protein